MTPPPPRTLRRLGVTTVVTAVASLCLATGAFAWWTATGAASTSDGSGAASALSLTPAAATASVYPTGASTGDVATVVSNPNPFPVRVTSLVLDTTAGTAGFGVDAGHAACGVASLSFATQTNGGAGWTIPARSGGTNGTLAISLNDSLAMSASAPNACQGATFTVHLRPTGT